MQRVACRTVAIEEGSGVTSNTVMPFIGGRPLTDLLRRIELPSATADGQPDLASSYIGLSAINVRWPSRHFLGEPVLSVFDEGETPLLGCGCGIWECWPFTAHVDVQDDVVAWSRYRHGFRDWDYSDLWDLTFDRQEYETALRSTAARH